MTWPESILGCISICQLISRAVQPGSGYHVLHEKKTKIKLWLWIAIYFQHIFCGFPHFPMFFFKEEKLLTAAMAARHQLYRIFTEFLIAPSLLAESGPRDPRDPLGPLEEEMLTSRNKHRSWMIMWVKAIELGHIWWICIYCVRLCMYDHDIYIYNIYI